MNAQQLIETANTYAEPSNWQEQAVKVLKEQDLLIKLHQENYKKVCLELNTHPAKESRAKDRFSNYESICAQCGTTIYKPAFKTLTDEEIDYCWSHSHGNTPWMKQKAFARAILKKASE